MNCKNKNTKHDSIIAITSKTLQTAKPHKKRNHKHPQTQNLET